MKKKNAIQQRIIHSQCHSVKILDQLESNPGEVRAQAYDIVLNGYELGGGSLRIFERDIQEKMFKVLGFSEEEAKEQFGFLMDAFEYGTPPHGGLAIGLDRLIMLLAGRTNLRDTIAFPKTASASDLLTDAPSAVSRKTVTRIKLKISTNKKIIVNFRISLEQDIIDML